MADEERTTTRTRLEAVEEELHLCRNCDQAYQPDEMLTVGVDISEHYHAYAKRKLCVGCADSVLHYSEPNDHFQHVAETVAQHYRKIWLAGLPWLAGTVALLFAVLVGDVVATFEGAAAIIATGTERTAASVTGDLSAIEIATVIVSFIGGFWGILELLDQ